MKPALWHWSVPTVFVALVAGALLVAGLLVWQPLAPPQMRSWSWSGAQLTPLLGTYEPRQQAARVQLDSHGQALLAVPVTTPVEVAGSGYLIVAGSGLSRLERATVLWQRVQIRDPLFAEAIAVEPVRQMPLPAASWMRIRLPLAHEPAWQGQIARLAISFAGAAHETVRIDHISFYPDTLIERLRALLADWAVFSPWNQAAINGYPARTVDPPGWERVPLVAIWLCLSIFLYAVWLLWTQGRWDWRAPSVLCLAGWLMLDLPWQWHLAQQLADTRRIFAALDDEQARRADPFSGALYAFAVEIKRLIAPRTRVFVGSADDYRGMRLNYYLYPLNVFWSRHGEELPAAHWLMTGDYIALAYPSRVVFDATLRELQWSPQQRIAVEPLWLDDAGGLFRVIARDG